MGRIIVIFCVALWAIQLANSAPIETQKLKFKLSARDLPDKDDIGDSDPYVELSYTEEGKKEEVKLGKTSTLTDTGNPDWGEAFELDFVRSKRQRLILRVYDEDNLREDDNLGQAYIDVADFVDKGQHLTVNLNKKGYVILESTVPVPPSPPPLPPTQNNTKVTPVENRPVPVLPPAPVTLQAQRLRFKLSAKDLPNKDKTGHSDPFVEILYTEGGSAKQKKLAVSSVVEDNPNPQWKDVFEFNYDPTKAQKWFFEVRDSDKGDSDGIGEVWVDVMDYVSKGQKITINLVKTGTLTIEAATPPTPAPPKPSPTLKPTPPTTTKSPITKLKFRLYVRNLEDKDLLGTSDPYVKVYTQQGSDKEVFLGNTEKFQDKEDADFGDVFEFNYNPAVKSKFRFLVLDEDDNRMDDELGNVSVDVADYVKSGENLTLNLGKKGTITVIKAN